MVAGQKSLSFKTRSRQYLEYLVVRWIICVVQIVPLEWCSTWAKWFAILANDIFKFRKKTTDKNLAAVFKDLSKSERELISRRMWEHLFLMACEIAQAPRTIHEATWREYVDIRDKKRMTEYFLDGRPLVMVSGHFGNFEIASYVAGVLGIPTHSIAKPIGNRYINKFIRRFRGSRGQYFLPYNESTHLVSEVLEANGILTLLGDQHAGSRGVWIDFFGREAACHKALALFTLTQKAPMLVVYARRKDKPMQFEVGCVDVAEPDELSDSQNSVRGLTQWYNDQLETIVREDPEQYWWLHKRWKERLPRIKKRAA